MKKEPADDSWEEMAALWTGAGLSVRLEPSPAQRGLL